jgi:hypothetical protein
MKFPNASAISPSDHEVSRGLVILGRVGLAARGVVYVTVGTLTAMAGLGVGSGKITDQKDAVRALGRSPFGDVVLWIVAIGLACYVLWRFGQVLFARLHESDTMKRWGKRAAALGSGLAYAGLSATAFAQALGSGGGKKGDSTQEEGAAWLLSQPAGAWLVGVVGAVIAGIAIAQFKRAYSASFTKHLRGGEMTHDQEQWARRAGRAGFAARGVAFALIAWFFLQAALQHDARQAGGLSAALQTIAAQDSGSTLLAIVGAGLALFGVYSLVEARYRHIQ